MLLGILRMPFDTNGDTHLIQLHDACLRAADRIESIHEVVYYALVWGIISRGKACEALGIDRCDLDVWIADMEGESDAT